MTAFAPIGYLDCQILNNLHILLKDMCFSHFGTGSISIIRNQGFLMIMYYKVGFPRDGTSRCPFVPGQKNFLVPVSLCPGTRAGANVPGQNPLSRDVPGQNYFPILHINCIIFLSLFVVAIFLSSCTSLFIPLHLYAYLNLLSCKLPFAKERNCLQGRNPPITVA